jgi:hypothetical protein
MLVALKTSIVIPESGTTPLFWTGEHAAREMAHGSVSVVSSRRNRIKPE